jgi:hypothetical protein
VNSLSEGYITKNELNHKRMKAFLLVLILAPLYLSVYAGQIELKGAYQGDNLYVKNPFSVTGVGFCVYEVTVNGMTTTDEINSSAFEIDLSVFGFRLGEPISVRINYKEECSPQVLNPDVLNPRASFEIESLHISGDKIFWKTRNEAGSLPYIVEQFRWNKWVAVAEIQGKGIPGQHNYSSTIRLHAGDNRFRIRQTTSNRKSKISAELSHKSTKAPVDFRFSADSNFILFSSPTMYELYDGFGRIIVKGYGETLRIDNLEKGRYYLNYEDKTELIMKR